MFERALSLLSPARVAGALGAAALLAAGCAAPPEKTEPLPELVFPPPPEQPRFYFERMVLSTGAAEGEDDEQRLHELLTGVQAGSGLAFAKPFDVAVYRGRVYLSDTIQRAVLVMDFAARRSFEIGTAGDSGDLQKPLGVAVDGQGLLYVVDGTRKVVNVYDQDGKFLRNLGAPSLFRRPSGIDVDPAGERVFVVDTGGVDTREHRVLVLDAVSGDLVRTIGARGAGPGELNLPRDVKLSPANGLLYVTDGGNFRVQAYTQDGAFVREWGEPGRLSGHFSRPKGISVDADGNVYVVDAAFGNFQIFDPEGRLLLFIGDRSTTQDRAKYMLPAGIDVDEDGRVYMVDQYFRKLEIYRPAGLKEDEGYLAGKPLR